MRRTQCGVEMKVGRELEGVVHKAVGEGERILAGEEEKDSEFGGEKWKEEGGCKVG